MQLVKKCNHISTTSAGIGPTYTIQGGLTWDHYLSLGTQFHLIYLKTSCDKTFCTNQLSWISLISKYSSSPNSPHPQYTFGSGETKFMISKTFYPWFVMNLIISWYFSSNSHNSQDVLYYMFKKSLKSPW